MSKILSPYFVNLTQDACLKAFWYKRTLKSFLRQCGIAEAVLSRLDGDEYKSSFLSYLFSELAKYRDEKHNNVILLIAKSIVEMASFPDLVGLEDAKQKIAVASEARDTLKKEYEKLEISYVAAGDKEMRLAEKARRDEFAAHEQRHAEFVKRLADLQRQAGEQKAGYDFEDWIYDFLTFNDIQARKPYKDPSGRQIDGAAVIDGNNFLVEAKCTRELTDVTEIDSFRAKIQTKADNTLGLLVSMSGFNKGAIDEAAKGRTPFVLIDGGHLFNLVVPRILSIKEIILRVLRHAAQTGIPYLSVSEF